VTSPPRDSRRWAAVGGALGGSVALLVLLLARVGGGSPGILEVVTDALIHLMPHPLFDWGIKSLGPAARGLLFAGVCLGVPAAGTAIAWLMARVGWLRSGAPLASGALLTSGALLAGLAGLALALGELVVLPLTGAGVAGNGLVSDPGAVHLPLAVASVAYGMVTVAYVAGRGRAGEPRTEEREGWGEGGTVAEPTDRQPITRRSLLAGGALVVGLGSLAASGVVGVARMLPPRRQALAGPADAAGVEGFGFVRAVTPVPEFYFVSKDWVPLDIDPAAWRLAVSGLVREPREWSLDELRALPGQEGYRTLQCISAESITRSTLIGNQRWAGVRVRDVLDAAGADPAAGFVIWRCADGYHESTDMATARADDSWLVYEMGPPGTLLAAEHGRPLRLLVAGRYGMAQPKHLTDMIVSRTDEPGWWVVGGWRTDAPVRTYCRIDLPAADGISDSVMAGQAFTAFGVASSGDRGISAVQVSTDGGASWRDTDLEPLGGPIGRLTWVRWRALVRLDAPGQVLFMARAADGTGTWQDEELSEPFPAGASGYPRVPMRVYASVGGTSGT
jgi:DMSO/TMAO reductase YedYZ molybdopterin-dependent catalytic subunit